MPNEENDDRDVDTEVDEADDTGAEGGDDESGEGEGEWTPPTKADWDNVQEALRKARRDARAAKRRPGKAAEGKAGDGEGADPEKVREQAESAAAEKYRPVIVRSAARSAFTAAGLVLPEDKGKADAAMSRALRLLDVEDVEIDDDGAVAGLDEQIEEIKADFPEMFTAPQSRRARRVDAGGRSNGGGRAKSSAELIAAQLTG